MKTRHLCTVLHMAAVVVCGAGCHNSPTAPTPTPPYAPPFLSFTATAGDMIGHGQSQHIDLTAVSHSAGMSGDNRVMDMSINGSSLGFFNPIELRLAAPAGQTLTRGLYPNALYRIDGESLALTLGGTSCNSIGQFEVLDIAWGSNGNVTRLHATFKQSCTATPADSISGEVLID